MASRYETIAGWINTKGWTAGAELGLFDGKTSRYLLAHCPGMNRLVGVDIFDSDAGFAEGPSKSGERCRCRWCEETRTVRRSTTAAQRQRACRDLTAADGRFILIETATASAALSVPDGVLDFVFVDADHSTEGVDADITNWLPKLSPNGWMIGHDWNMRSVRNGVWSHFSMHGGVVSHADDPGGDHLWWVGQAPRYHRSARVVA